MNTFLADLRFGVRVLLKSPTVTIVAIIALALGIGANTAIFSVVNAVLLRPLPFPNSDQLVSLFAADRQGKFQRGPFSYPDFFDVRSQNTVFEKIASYYNADYILTGRGEPARVQGAVVSADLFPLLGIKPLYGRTFTPDEDKPSDAGSVVILSEQLWHRQFNSDPSVINQSVTLAGANYTIVGVMPASFQFPIQNDPVDLWTTIAQDATGKSPAIAQRNRHFPHVVGRLKPNVTLAQVQTELTAIAARLEQQYPDTNTDRNLRVQSLLLDVVGNVRPALLILLGAVACVLLIACANVANLLLARGTSRYKEMAIRAALGASRVRVMRQLLTESIMLSLLGGVAGLLLAIWWSDLLLALGREDIPRAVDVGLDWRVLGFTFGVSVLTGVIFGLFPAFHSSKTELVESLKEGGRGTGEGARRNRMRSVLAVGELSIAVVLLVAAGLLIQSLWRLQSVDIGLRPDKVVTFNIELPVTKYNTDKQAHFFADLKTRLESSPGVQSASSILPLPLSGDFNQRVFQIQGREVARKDEPWADVAMIGVGYFRTMGIPIVKGRDFDQRDQHGAPGVVIISEEFAHQYFPGEDPIGKRISPEMNTFEGETPTYKEIVGVVGDVRNSALSNDPQPAYYLPEMQVPYSQMTLVVKSSGDPHSVVTATTKELAAIDPDLPVFDVKTMREYVTASVVTPRFSTTLLSIFAGVALVLTLVGLYGVMSYSVAQRTNEIGIRLALGAQSRDVLLMIVKQGSLLILLGLSIGLLGAYALTRLISSLLFGVTAKDPFTFGAAAVLLGMVALLACYIPARRATKVDPLEALRYE